MKGYYKMPKATASAIDKDGWLHTGDLACKTEDGNYKITGRLKDMIIRGGENIYPHGHAPRFFRSPVFATMRVRYCPRTNRLKATTECESRTNR